MRWVVMGPPLPVSGARPEIRLRFLPCFIIPSAGPNIRTTLVIVTQGIRGKTWESKCDTFVKLFFVIYGCNSKLSQLNEIWPINFIKSNIAGFNERKFYNLLSLYYSLRLWNMSSLSFKWGIKFPNKTDFPFIKPFLESLD